MATYINSQGDQIDPATMPDVYLERALAKAIRDGNQDNIDVLQAEYDARKAGPQVDASA